MPLSWAVAVTISYSLSFSLCSFPSARRHGLVFQCTDFGGLLTRVSWFTYTSARLTNLNPQQQAAGKMPSTARTLYCLVAAWLFASSHAQTTETSFPTSTAEPTSTESQVNTFTVAAGRVRSQKTPLRWSFADRGHREDIPFHQMLFKPRWETSSVRFT